MSEVNKILVGGPTLFSPASLQLLMHHVPVVFWTTDRDLRLTSYMSSTARPGAPSPQERIGKSLIELIKADAPATDIAIQNHYRVLNGETAKYTYDHGGYIYDAHLEPLKAADGTIIGVNGVALDVTDHVKLERRLADTKNSYEQLIHSVDGIVWEANPKTFSFLFVSQRAEKILGYPVSHWYQPNFWLSRLHPEDLPWAPEFCLSAIREKKDNAFEYRMLAADGRTVWLRDIVTVVLNDEGEVVKLTGVMVDITQFKQAEASLRVHARELVRSNTALQQFAYIASHDLQEPLRTVSCFMELLFRKYESVFDEDAKFYSRYAIEGAKRMQGLISSLLEYSRVGHPSKKFEKISCHKVLEEVLAHLHPAILESGARIEICNLPHIEASASQLWHLFQNLIANAIKFRKHHAPRIRILAKEAENKCWHFHVEDDGIGFDMQYCEKVFHVFYRIHGAQYPGTGVGLAICRQIVESHGGKIWAESTPERGTTIHFLLPERPGVTTEPPQPATGLHHPLAMAGCSVPSPGALSPSPQQV